MWYPRTHSKKGDGQSLCSQSPAKHQHGTSSHHLPGATLKWCPSPGWPVPPTLTAPHTPACPAHPRLSPSQPHTPEPHDPTPACPCYPPHMQLPCPLSQPRTQQPCLPITPAPHTPVLPAPCSSPSIPAAHTHIALPRLPRHTSIADSCYPVPTPQCRASPHIAASPF